MSSELEAELERRLKAQYEPAKPEKRSYSPAPTSGPASLHPTEKALRDAAWSWFRKRLPAGALIVVLGGAGSFGGRKAQDAARDAAHEAAQAEQAKLRREVQAAQGEILYLSGELVREKRERGVLSGAHEALAADHRKLQAQVNALEAARTVVVRAEADRAPRP
ncbi:MAG TPA: hypothetical protein VGK73_13670 [Polyangiaceae bacterium]